MKRKLIATALLLVFVGTVAVIGNAWAALDEAKAMVEKAAKFVQENGKDIAIQEFNNPKSQFVEGDLYIFAWDLQGTNIAHPHNPKQVGVNVVEVPDVNGKLFRKEALEKALAEGTAVVDYKFKNPTTNKVEDKITYFKKVGDIIVGCGAYK